MVRVPPVPSPFLFPSSMWPGKALLRWTFWDSNCPFWYTPPSPRQAVRNTKEMACG
jgi:hypothetical protein